MKPDRDLLVPRAGATGVDPSLGTASRFGRSRGGLRTRGEVWVWTRKVRNLERGTPCDLVVETGHELTLRYAEGISSDHRS